MYLSRSVNAQPQIGYSAATCIKDIGINNPSHHG